jgi:cytochrome c oxidase subunit 1
MIPMMIGAPDGVCASQQPSWVAPPAALLLVLSLFVPGGAAAGAGRFIRR